MRACCSHTSRGGSRGAGWAGPGRGLELIRQAPRCGSRSATGAGRGGGWCFNTCHESFMVYPGRAGRGGPRRWTGQNVATARPTFSSIPVPPITAPHPCDARPAPPRLDTGSPRPHDNARAEARPRPRPRSRPGSGRGCAFLGLRDAQLIAEISGVLPVVYCPEGPQPRPGPYTPNQAFYFFSKKI